MSNAAWIDSFRVEASRRYAAAMRERAYSAEMMAMSRSAQVWQAAYCDLHRDVLEPGGRN